MPIISNLVTAASFAAVFTLALSVSRPIPRRANRISCSSSPTTWADHLRDLEAWKEIT
jgi:hypothetical protein